MYINIIWKRQICLVLAITVGPSASCVYKTDGRKLLVSLASPLEIRLVYSVLAEYSPVTKAHNGAAGS